MLPACALTVGSLLWLLQAGAAGPVPTAPTVKGILGRIQRNDDLLEFCRVYAPNAFGFTATTGVQGKTKVPDVSTQTGTISTTQTTITTLPLLTVDGTTNTMSTDITDTRYITIVSPLEITLTDSISVTPTATLTAQAGTLTQTTTVTGSSTNYVTDYITTTSFIFVNPSQRVKRQQQQQVPAVLSDFAPSDISQACSYALVSSTATVPTPTGFRTDYRPPVTTTQTAVATVLMTESTQNTVTQDRTATATRTVLLTSTSLSTSTDFAFTTATVTAAPSLTTVFEAETVTQTTSTAPTSVETTTVQCYAVPGEALSSSECGGLSLGIVPNTIGGSARPLFFNGLTNGSVLSEGSGGSSAGPGQFEARGIFVPSRGVVYLTTVPDSCLTPRAFAFGVDGKIGYELTIAGCDVVGKPEQTQFMWDNAGGVLSWRSSPALYAVSENPTRVFMLDLPEETSASAGRLRLKNGL